MILRSLKDRELLQDNACLIKNYGVESHRIRSVALFIFSLSQQLSEQNSNNRRIFEKISTFFIFLAESHALLPYLMGERKKLGK